ncbi:MAG: hypothetical protein P8Y97_21285 [Candidatus Lokiarchaeota archaeon]
MYNKIRVILGNIWKIQGYPVRLHCRVAFPHHIMISIPNNMEYSIARTWTMYQDQGSRKYDPSSIYRYVILIQNAPEGTPLGFIENMFNMVTLGLFSQIVEGDVTEIKYPIFENIVSPGGINNKVIDANWDKIKATITYWGD